MKCNLCRRYRSKKLYQLNNKKVVRCVGCGLIFISGERLTGKDRSYYENLYWGNPESSFYDYYYGRRLKGLHEFYLKMAERYSGRNGSLVDVGAGLGYFVKLAKEKGWEAKGIEISFKAVSYTRKRLGIKLVRAEFGAGKNEGKYDVVCAFHVLEHLDNPRSFLDKVCRNLKPGGILLLEVPNANSILFKLRGSHAYDPVAHKFYFTKDTLVKLVSSSGLMIEQAESRQSRRTTLLTSLVKISRKRRRILETDSGAKKSLSAYKVIGEIDNLIYPIKVLMAKVGWGEELFLVARKGVA